VAGVPNAGSLAELRRVWLGGRAGRDAPRLGLGWFARDEVAEPNISAALARQDDEAEAGKGIESVAIFCAADSVPVHVQGKRRRFLPATDAHAANAVRCRKPWNGVRCFTLGPCGGSGTALSGLLDSPGSVGTDEEDVALRLRSPAADALDQEPVDTDPSLVPPASGVGLVAVVTQARRSPRWGAEVDACSRAVPPRMTSPPRSAAVAPNGRMRSSANAPRGALRRLTSHSISPRSSTCFRPTSIF
jgi:hypothetical protein